MHYQQKSLPQKPMKQATVHTGRRAQTTHTYHSAMHLPRTYHPYIRLVYGAAIEYVAVHFTCLEPSSKDLSIQMNRMAWFEKRKKRSYPMASPCTSLRYTTITSYFYCHQYLVIYPN